MNTLTTLTTLTALAVAVLAFAFTARTLASVRASRDYWQTIARDALAIASDNADRLNDTRATLALVRADEQCALASLVSIVHAWRAYAHLSRVPHTTTHATRTTARLRDRLTALASEYEGAFVDDAHDDTRAMRRAVWATLASDN